MYNLFTRRLRSCSGSRLEQSTSPSAHRACNNRTCERQHGGQSVRGRPRQNHCHGPPRARRLTQRRAESVRACGVAGCADCKRWECGSDGRAQSPPLWSAGHRPDGRGFGTAIHHGLKPDLVRSAFDSCRDDAIERHSSCGPISDMGICHSRACGLRSLVQP